MTCIEPEPVVLHIFRVIAWGVKHLRKIKEARLVSELLLAHVLGVELDALYDQIDRVLTGDEFATFQHFIKRLNKGEEREYIMGYTTFFGMKLKLKRYVLIPRTYTIELIDAILKRISPLSRYKILDVGTGCGVIGSFIANKRCFVEVVGVDISKNAIEMAKENAKFASDRITLLQGSWFRPVRGMKFDIIASHPPAVSLVNFKKLIFTHHIKFEPKSAFVSKNAGFSAIDHIIKNAPDFLAPKGRLFLLFPWKFAGKALKIAKELRYYQGIKIKKDSLKLSCIFSAQLKGTFSFG